jgi:hypothetical protein
MNEEKSENNRFEEQFPSLDKALNKYDRSKLNFPLEELKACCLDKQRVKEAIEKFFSVDFGCDSQEFVGDVLEDLKKELGL